MKKRIKTVAFAVVAIMALGLQSCSSEESMVSAPVEARNVKELAPEVVAFQKEWLQLVKEKNSSQNKSDEAVTAKFKSGLSESAKRFLLASGIPESELQAQTEEQKTALRVRALRLMSEKSN